MECPICMITDKKVEGNAFKSCDVCLKTFHESCLMMWLKQKVDNIISIFGLVTFGDFVDCVLDIKNILGSEYAYYSVLNTKNELLYAITKDRSQVPETWEPIDWDSDITISYEELYKDTTDYKSLEEITPLSPNLKVKYINFGHDCVINFSLNDEEEMKKIIV